MFDDAICQQFLPLKDTAQFILRISFGLKHTFFPFFCFSSCILFLLFIFLSFSPPHLLSSPAPLSFSTSASFFFVFLLLLLFSFFSTSSSPLFSFFFYSSALIQHVQYNNNRTILKIWNGTSENIKENRHI